MITSTSDWITETGWRGKYFLSLTTGVTRSPRLRHRPITGRLFQIVLTVLTTRVGCRHIAYVLHKKWLVVAVFCSAKLLWDIRLFVWRQFHFFCGTAISCTCILQTTAFSCYGFHFIYVHAMCVSSM